MRRAVIFLITFYQIILSPLLKQLTGTSTACRYKVSCSAFAKKNIQEYGIIRGGKMSIERLLTCHPFAKQL